MPLEGPDLVQVGVHTHEGGALGQVGVCVCVSVCVCASMCVYVYQCVYVFAYMRKSCSTRGS